uniref:NADH dehydrogenase subunit 1 n=1 Tax=Sclomina xingrensis TaxID=2930961 RepID=UPI002551EE4C|nr:NADH dehydrogenase subunit 1 [Sclomina xingrensis]WGT89873.1 NADH dehydrogenase subunit 1 [Sclomina xingrensis]WGT89886.1 NADH dehydrogenase subunit 1 [Sclomina xingrensis]WGT89899.1 NADH dehydrogenase subunit 1 [Sclomina xingrensis]WGT89912.1 NADH dehydrogenase subunit 1 [Sclomina xingrensis]WGT89925.1 NADH dehydrogenase subunit 1 [Sclomina xingrensis]
MFLVSYFLTVILILVGVAFTTLLERKVLGYIQLRKGPNKVGFMGLLQPFSDGLKLFFKEQTFPSLSNFIVYYISPVFLLTLSFTLWVLFPYFINVYNFNFGALFFLCCTGMGVYGVLLSGWSSNSNYALLGGLRSVAQTISYEVSMALILVCMLIFIFGFNLVDFMFYQSYIWFIFFSFPLFFCWISSCLAETNRSPFDFAEGESELVSGFNVEYSSGGFAFIFLAEYMNIIFMSLLSCVIFLGCDLYSIKFFIKWTFLIFLFIWVRGTFPRYRYDKLMYLTWSVFLPISLYYLLFFSSVMVLFV